MVHPLCVEYNITQHGYDISRLHQISVLRMPLAVPFQIPMDLVSDQRIYLSNVTFYRKSITHATGCANMLVFLPPFLRSVAVGKAGTIAEIGVGVSVTVTLNDYWRTFDEFSIFPRHGISIQKGPDIWR
mgnify:CR=1 FL=1